MSKEIPIVLVLTRRQAILVEEQMDKGAAAWEDAWACNCARQVAVKIRRMLNATSLTKPRKVQDE